MIHVINLIVHEDAVREHALEGNLEAIGALTIIDELLGKPDTYEIKDNPFYLPLGLPQPQGGLNVIVRGGYRRQCCIRTLYSLREAGYIAELGNEGIFDNGFKMPPAYEPSDLRILVPEYCQM